MDSIKNRFPSRLDTFYVFAACVLPVFLWAILSYLDAFPGFALRLTIWDLIGTASYVLGFALLESILLLLPWVLLAAILPHRVFKDRFVALASIVILISSAWMMYANYHLLNFARLARQEWITGGFLYFITLAIPIALVVRSKRVERLVQALIQRVAVLAYIYVALGCLAILIVILRNL